MFRELLETHINLKIPLETEAEMEDAVYNPPQIRSNRDTTSSLASHTAPQGTTLSPRLPRARQTQTKAKTRSLEKMA